MQFIHDSNAYYKQFTVGTSKAHRKKILREATTSSMHTDMETVHSLSIYLSPCPWLLCNTHTDTTTIQTELPQHGELAQVVLVIAQCYSLLSLPLHNAICSGGGEGCHQKLAGPGPAFSGEKACKAFLVINSFPDSIRNSGISPTLSHPNLRIHDCSVHDNHANQNVGMYTMVTCCTVTRFPSCFTFFGVAKAGLRVEIRS